MSARDHVRNGPTWMALALSAGCALRPSGPGAFGPEARATQAVEALERESYESARLELLSLAARCEAGEHGRDALLLLAVSELDPMNPFGSPDEAARLAAAYLELPDPDVRDALLARATYRLAVDLGGVVHDSVTGASRRRAPPVAERFEACEGRPLLPVPAPLPTTPELTTAARLAALRTDLQAKSTSLSASARERDDLRMRTTTLQARIDELEAELDRIKALLRDGAVGSSRRAPR